MSEFEDGTIELNLDEASTAAVLKMLEEQDREHIDRVFAGEEGINLGCSDGRHVELIPKPQWISCKKRLPEIDRLVLIRWPNDDMAVAYLRDIDEDWTIWRVVSDEEWACECEHEPTHWMELPTPPRRKTNGNS